MRATMAVHSVKSSHLSISGSTALSAATAAPAATDDNALPPPWPATRSLPRPPWLELPPDVADVAAAAAFRAASACKDTSTVLLSLIKRLQAAVASIPPCNAAGSVRACKLPCA